MFGFVFFLLWSFLLYLSFVVLKDWFLGIFFVMSYFILFIFTYEDLSKAVRRRAKPFHLAVNFFSLITLLGILLFIGQTVFSVRPAHYNWGSLSQALIDERKDIFFIIIVSFSMGIALMANLLRKDRNKRRGKV